MDRIADELEALRAEQQALRALVEEQRALIDRLSDAAATRPGAAPAPPATADATRDEDDLPDRRRFFARAAAAGVAGAAGLVVGTDRAAAADGDPVLLRQAHGLNHGHRVAGMKTARQIGRCHVRHERFIRPHMPVAETLAAIDIDVECPRHG